MFDGSLLELNVKSAFDKFWGSAPGGFFKNPMIFVRFWVLFLFLGDLFAFPTRNMYSHIKTHSSDMNHYLPMVRM